MKNTMSQKKMMLALLAPVVMGSTALAGTYNLDTSHGEVGFSVKHMMISNVKGRFNKYEGSFQYDEKKKELKDLVVSVDIASVDTNSADRDKHLKSPDFFDVEKFPKMTFKSDKVEFKGKKVSKIIGTLTIKDKSKSITLTVDDKGGVVDPWGNERVGFEANGTIDRKEFGLTWNKALDKGGVAVGDEVKIHIEGEAILKKDAPAAK